jgi:hypothetical protein
MPGSVFTNGAFSMGFDGSPAGALLWTQLNNGSANSSITPYGRGFSWYIGNGCGILLGENITTLTVGFWWYGASLPSSGWGTAGIFSFFDATAAAIQVALRLSTTGQLGFFLGSGTGTQLGASSAALTLQADVGAYIEVNISGVGASSSLTCHVNGSAVITAASVNTKSTANAYVNAVQFLQPAGSSYYIDDWYMLDGSGALGTTFFGIVQVCGDAASANSAVGGRNAWIGSPATGANTYQNVAHVPANIADYDYDNTVGNYDMFRFPTLPAGYTVMFMTEWAVTLLDAAGPRTVGLNIYSGGTDSLATAFTPSSSPTLVSQTSLVDPNTNAAWLLAAAAAAELGVKVVS